MHSNSHIDKGTLFVTATPIGNMGDITLRAVETLKKVDIVAAEDTRHTKRLLNHLDIKKKLTAIHEHNEIKISDVLINDMKNGKNVALVSDAGTPTVSDPGYILIKKTIESEIDVVPIPGVSAAITALSVSGLPSDSFIFIGFTPKKKGKRTELLSSLKNERRTLIFYESPNRILSFIDELKTVFGDRSAVLSREMTKLHEEFIRGSFEEISEVLSLREKIKGECTLIVEGAGKDRLLSDDEIEKMVRERVLDGRFGSSALAKEISKELNIPKGKIYNMILKLKDG